MDLIDPDPRPSLDPTGTTPGRAAGGSTATRALPWAVAALLAATALLHGVHAVLAARDPYLQFRVGDEGFYDAWGRAIAGGALAPPGPFFTTPLFAYWLAALDRLGLTSVAAVLAADALLGVAAVWATWSAARRLVGERGAFVAATLVALARPVLVYEAAPEKTTLVLALTAAAFAAAAWTAERPTWRRSAVAGGLAGLAALSHALTLLVVPAALAHLAVNLGVRRAVRPVAAYVAGTLLALAPVTVHNALASRELILVCSNGGHNLYIGNHAGNETGLYTSPPFSRANLAVEEQAFRDEAERRTGRRLAPGQVSAFWTRQALREMAATPGLTIRRFLRKVRWAVNREELTDTRTYGFYASRFPTTRHLLWDFGLPSVLGLLGACALWRRRWAVLPVAFAAAYVLALGAFFVYGRYRLPLLVPAAILAGGLAAEAPTLLAERRLAVWALRLGAVAAAVALVFGTVLPGVQESWFPDFFNQGNRYLAAGRAADALREFEEAITVKPGDHPAVAPLAIDVANMQLSRGDRAAAVRVLTEASRVRPDDPRLRAALERVLAGGGA